MFVSVKVSLTFDPFSVLSVPIPKKKQAITVMFFSAFPSQKPIKVEQYLSFWQQCFVLWVLFVTVCVHLYHIGQRIWLLNVTTTSLANLQNSSSATINHHLFPIKIQNSGIPISRLLLCLTSSTRSIIIHPFCYSVTVTLIASTRQTAAKWLYLPFSAPCQRACHSFLDQTSI